MVVGVVVETFVLGVIVAAVVVPLIVPGVVVEVCTGSVPILEEAVPVFTGVELMEGVGANINSSCGIFASGCPRAEYSAGVSLIS